MSAPSSKAMPPRVVNIAKRQHPDHENKRLIWDFLLASFRGGMGMQGRTGKSDIVKARDAHGYYAGLFRWRKENDDDYIVRRAMTPYRPYARRIVRSFVNYATNEPPNRKGDKPFADLIENVDRKGTKMLKFVRHCLTMQAVMGEFNILVDMPEVITPPVSKLDAEQQGVRPYCVPLMPQSIVDYDIDEYGLYSWAIIETKKLVNNPMRDKATVKTQRVFWDSEVYQIFEETSDKKWEMVRAGVHPVGRVPIIRLVYEDVDNDPLTPESWFYDLADLNRLIYNLESIDVVNFPNQCFGQLILPGQSTGNEDDARTASASEAWTELPDESGISRYIQTTGVEHEAIENKIKNVKQEMYNVAGLQHRTESREVESAEAKAWDFNEVKQFLKTFAEGGDYIEEQITELAAAWNNGSEGMTSEYNKDFDVHDLEKMIAAILDLDTLDYGGSETGRKEAMKQIYRLLFRLSDETQRKIDAEIDASEKPDPLEQFGGRFPEQAQGEQQTNTTGNVNA